MTHKLWLAPHTRSSHQLTMSFGIDDLHFSTSYWYNDVDLLELEKKFGVEYMENIYFHITAFEANKLTSLKPDVIDLGCYTRFHTAEFEKLWSTIQHNVWAQWRYENNAPDYKGVRFLSTPIAHPTAVQQLDTDNDNVLIFCGGGKDSLVSLKLAERASIPYSSCAYSSSIYGSAAAQHQLIGSLVESLQPEKQHKIWMYDDFLDSPVVELAKEYQISSLTAAETPSSIFASLPIVLQHHYRYISLGHERSADTGNLIWDETGEEVNHQWGKSSEAELLLNTYLQKYFISNSHYFSLLKPIYDVNIFALLQQDLAHIPFTHSCNISKPWCKKCAKCAYVWLNYMAYLPVDLVNNIFSNVNLFDIPENQLWFRQMLGLEAHTPFECIGQIDEARLAFELCRHKGLTGQAMTIFIDNVKDFDVESTIKKYTVVNDDYPFIPQEMAEKVKAIMKESAKNNQTYLSNLLKKEHIA